MKFALLLALCGLTAAAFTASETLDIGVDLGSTVSLSYFEKRPFQFAGKFTL